MASTDQNREVERARIGSLYQAIMRQVVIRADAMAVSMAEARSNPEHPNNWQNAEFCYLQIRKICEYVALALLSAHHEYEGTKASKIQKQWNAATLFDQIGGMNRYAFPVPTNIELDANGPGSHHVEPAEVVLEPHDLERIYGQAGDRLHVGSLKRLVDGKLPPYDFRELSDWRNRFIKTLNSHMIRLPHVGSVLLVHLKDESDGDVHCAFGDADGGFIIGDDPTPFNVERVT